VGGADTLTRGATAPRSAPSSLLGPRGGAIRGGSRITCTRGPPDEAASLIRRNVCAAARRRTTRPLRAGGCRSRAAEIAKPGRRIAAGCRWRATRRLRRMARQDRPRPGTQASQVKLTRAGQRFVRQLRSPSGEQNRALGSKTSSSRASALSRCVFSGPGQLAHRICRALAACASRRKTAFPSRRTVPTGHRDPCSSRHRKRASPVGLCTAWTSWSLLGVRRRSTSKHPLKPFGRPRQNARLPDRHCPRGTVRSGRHCRP